MNKDWKEQTGIKDHMFQCVCEPYFTKIKETNMRTGESHIYKESDRIDNNGYACLFKDLEDGDIIKTEIIKE